MPNTLRLWFALAIALAAWPALAQQPEVPPDAMIRLQRTSCYGPCPIYTITIDASGTVTYEGERAVRVVGRRTAKIDTSTVAGLLARVESIRFFEMRDAYRVIENPDGTVSMVTDLPTKFVTVTVNGRTKKVEDFAPPVIGDFRVRGRERAVNPPGSLQPPADRQSGWRTRRGFRQRTRAPRRRASRRIDGGLSAREHV
jgi:Domain of unknown function (DUF6438)